MDINYLMLWGSLHADLTSKSIGDPKACKAKQDPVDERGNDVLSSCSRDETD